MTLPFDELLELKRDNGLRASFTGVVLRASPSDSTGYSGGENYARMFTVTTTPEVAAPLKISIGDTIRRVKFKDAELTVQQIVNDPDFGLILTCTAEERSLS